MQNRHSLLNGLIAHSSTLLLTAMMLSFLLMFGVQMFYYADIFKDVVPNIGFAYGIGIAIGVMTQLGRFAFGVSGAYEFAKGYYAKGAGGLLFSFCITLFEAFEVHTVAIHWSNGNPVLHDPMLLLFQFLIWTGFCLELRLAMNVSGDGNSPMGSEQKAQAVTFSKNGTTKKAVRSSS